MKNLIYLVLSVVFIGFVLVACEDGNESDFIVEDEVQGLKTIIAPQDQLLVEMEIDIEDVEIIKPSVKSDNVNSRNGDCGNYENVTELLITRSYCTQTTSAVHCQYLDGYYSLAALSYEFDCLPELFCLNCESYFEYAEGILEWTLANGYLAGPIQQWIDAITIDCASCPTEDPCEEECAGVEIETTLEEFQFGGKTCCRMTWTLVDPNGCTDGTILAGTGANGPFIPGTFTTSNSGVLSGTLCEQESSEYWIQTGGECPQVFGPFKIECEKEDPCEQECEGVNIEVEEEIVTAFPGQNCCRLTFTLVDPNGCTDGTITEVRQGTTGPWIPGLFTSVSERVLQATSCDRESSDYYIRTGGECPQEFGPFTFDCHL